MLKRFFLISIIMMITVLVSASDLRAQDGSAAASSPAALAERSQVAQEEAQSSASQIEDQIAKINQTLRSNGIDEAQIRGIDAALHGISDLSSKDMASVIGTLQGVNTAGTDKARQDGLLTAYKGQQAIMQKISALIASIQIKESSDQLRLQLQDMLLRQISNRRLTADLQKLNQPVASLSERDKGRHDIAANGQTSLQANLTTVLSELDQLVVQLPPETVDAFKQKLQALHTDLLRQSALAANDAVRTGAWPAALQNQSQLMNGLLALSELIDTSGTAANLAQAAQDGARLLDAEKSLLGDAANRADRQVDIEDRTLLASLRLQSLNAIAAGKLAAADQSMEVIRTGADAKAATAAGQQAITSLQQALDLLKQQAEDVAKAQALTPQQRLDQLQALATQVAQQQAAAQNPAQTPPTAEDLAKLQQQAAPLSPQAAADLGKAAAAQANQAVQAANPANNPANQAANQAPGAQTPPTPANPSDPNSAAQQLAAAQADLQQQIAQAQAAAAQANQLAQAQTALQNANQQAAQAAQQMQTQAGLPNAVNPLLAAEKALQGAQQQQGLPDAAQQAMTQAAQAVQGAILQAAQGNQQAAQAGTQQTQQALGQAQAALAQSQGQGQGLGQNPGPPSSAESQMAQGQTSPTSQDSPQTTGLLGGAGADAANGSGLAVGKLTPKDREAIASMQGTKTPPEFAPMVSQYYKNLTDGTAR